MQAFLLVQLCSTFFTTASKIHNFFPTTNMIEYCIVFQMKWKFGDLTSRKTLAVHIKEEICDGVVPRYVVSLRDPDNDADDISETICKESKPHFVLTSLLILP